MSSYSPSPSFYNAAAYLSSSSSAGRASNAIKLELYGLFKYLTVTIKPMTSKPNIFDMTGRAKWDAWAATGSKYGDRYDEAEKRYIELAKEQGWDETASPPAAAPSNSGKEDKPEVNDADLLIDSDDDEPSPRTGQKGDGGEGGGMGLSVSAMLRPAETMDDTIHGITVKGDVVKLKSLIEGNPNLDIDQLDEYGYTPLHLACDRGHLDVVRLLLEKGADRTIKDPDEFTPLELAEVAGRNDIVALLSSK